MLDRTNLTDPQKVEFAAATVALQGQFGAISGLAAQYDVSRGTVYDVQTRTRQILEEHVLRQTSGSALWVAVDERQIRRAIVALRVIAPNSIRDIEDLLPILFPGLKISYGAIQAIVAEAEEKAKELNVLLDLSGIRAAALDEMFSQGDPVLAGVDLDAGLLFLLALHGQRSAVEWAAELKRCQEQGLDLRVVVKDAALGIAAGVREVFPDAEQRDDCFHAQYEMGKVKRQLEQRAYGAIARVDELALRIAKLEAQGKADKCEALREQLQWERKQCDAAIELFDAFEAAQREATEGMEVVDLERGTFRDAASMQKQMQSAAGKMLGLDNDQCRKVGRYIHNRAPGLALYAQQVHDELAEVAVRYGQEATLLACIMLRLVADLRGRKRAWRRGEDQRHLMGAYAGLQQAAGVDAEDVLSAVQGVFLRRHRASSAIEGFNAALRPYLYVHKGVTQGFLELFRFYFNHRTRRWGRHKGTSAVEAATGEVVEDWLERLGYPPSSQQRN